ncbi:F-box protein [Mycetohabitans sp. B46]|uniref:F-box protein n=1 Tax=Mycetohabitans sp. B46 TaxID=2772536 RepID=UPI00307CFD44
MDFDSASTLNSAQAALYAMQGQPAGRFAAAASPPPPHLAAQASTSARQRPTTYHDLPPEILQRVAAHMSLFDIPNLSAVDKRTYHALQEWRLSWFCTRNASEGPVPDFTSVQRLLTEIEHIRAELMLRAEPLRALSQQLRRLPEEQQTAAFQQVFKAAGRVPRQGLQ